MCSVPAGAETASASCRDLEGMPVCRYLSGRAAFGRLYGSGRRYRGRVMRIVCSENALGVTRLGFSVSSRLGGAIRRNLFKRRVRSLFREFSPGAVDIVVGAALPVAEITWQSLRQDVAEFGEVLRRWREQPSG